MQFKCRFVILCQVLFNYAKILLFFISNGPKKSFSNYLTFWESVFNCLFLKLFIKKCSLWQKSLFEINIGLLHQVLIINKELTKE